MKTTLTFIFSFIFLSYSTAFGQTVIWEDDFDGGFDPGWTQWSTNWGSSQVWNPNSNNGVNSSGAAMEASGPYFGAVSNWFQAPAVDLTSASNATLEFDFAFGSTSEPCQFSVWYSTGGNWNLITTYGAANSGANNTIPVATAADNLWTPSAGDWNHYSIDISQFQNQSNIRFSFGSDYMDAWTNGVWFLDNVQVLSNGATTSISDEFVASSFSTSPNPATSVLNITTSYSDYYNMRIVDLTGRVIIEQDDNSGNARIPTITLPSGIYVLQLEADGSVITEKFIKN